MIGYSATTALPYEHLERVTAGLRAELRHQLITAGVTDPPDWSALMVTGPFEAADDRGRTWFRYRGTLEAPR